MYFIPYVNVCHSYLLCHSFKIVSVTSEYVTFLNTICVTLVYQHMTFLIVM